MVYMGHSFDLLDCGFSGTSRDVRSGVSFLSTKRFFVLTLGLAVAVILPVSRAAAQATPNEPSGESDVQLLQPKGPEQAAPPATITLQDALERARKLDPTFLGATYDARSARDAPQGPCDAGDASLWPGSARAVARTVVGTP